MLQRLRQGLGRFGSVSAEAATPQGLAAFSFPPIGILPRILKSALRTQNFDLRSPNSDLRSPKIEASPYPRLVSFKHRSTASIAARVRASA